MLSNLPTPPSARPCLTRGPLLWGDRVGGPDREGGCEIGGSDLGRVGFPGLAADVGERGGAGLGPWGGQGATRPCGAGQLERQDPWKSCVCRGWGRGLGHKIAVARGWGGQGGSGAGGVLESGWERGMCEQGKEPLDTKLRSEGLEEP